MRTNFVIIMVSIALAGVAMAADSPISMGSLMIDGSIYYQSNSGDIWEDSYGNGISTVGAGSVELNQLTVDISPAVGYFVADGICLGAQIGVQSFSIGDHDKVNLFAIGPSLSYYGKINPSVADVKGSFYAYGRGYASFGSISDEDDNSTSVTQFGGNLGLA